MDGVGNAAHGRGIAQPEDCALRALAENVNTNFQDITDEMFNELFVNVTNTV